MNNLDKLEKLLENYEETETTLDIGGRKVKAVLTNQKQSIALRNNAEKLIEVIRLQSGIIASEYIALDHATTFLETGEKMSAEGAEAHKKGVDALANVIKKTTQILDSMEVE